MKIEFSLRLFNPLYWHIEEAFKNPNIRNILVMGGSSAGKTYSIAQNLVYNSLVEDNSTIVFRKESTSIDDSVYADFKAIASDINAYNEFFTIQDKKIITPNGKFRFRGLDDPEKVKGISQYNKVYLNELSKFELGDWNEVQRRMRGKPHLQIVADWNPISETHWIKTELIDRDEWEDMPLILNDDINTQLSDSSFKKINKAGDTILIRVTYLDNFWVVGSHDGRFGFYDKHTINNFEKMKTSNIEDYRVYALGEWGRLRTGGEFFHAFDRGKCVKKTVFDPKNAIFVSVDNNVLPYITITFYQFSREDMEIKQVHEICAAEPFNTSTKAGESAKVWLDSVGFEGSVVLCGDASAKARNTIDDDKKNFIDKFVEQVEVKYHVTDKISKSNPSVSLSGEFINSIWSGVLPYSIVIDESCKTSIADYENVKKDVDGSILKKRVKDKETGQTYEQYGHCSDTLRYAVTTILSQEYKAFINKRKRTNNKSDMKYFNSDADIKYKDKIGFCMPECNGKFIYLKVGVGEHNDILDIVYSDDVDDDKIKEISYVVVECDKPYMYLVRKLRERGFDVKGSSVKPHTQRISAMSEQIKDLRFRSDYDGNEQYTDFVNSVLDYDLKNNYEAINMLSFVAQYLTRIN